MKTENGNYVLYRTSREIMELKAYHGARGSLREEYDDGSILVFYDGYFILFKVKEHAPYQWVVKA